MLPSPAGYQPCVMPELHARTGVGVETAQQSPDPDPAQHDDRGFTTGQMKGRTAASGGRNQSQLKA